jgi:acetyl-CoA carboxylase carboxyltransferase component
LAWEPFVEEIERRKQIAREMGGPDRVADQHSRGKLTVRERIDALLDPGSFRERGALAGSAEYTGGEMTDFRPSGTVMGVGQIDGRPVVVSGSDFTARARPSGGRGGNKGGYAEEMAFGLKIPIVRLIDAFGADIRSIEAIGRTYIPGGHNVGSSSDHYKLYTEMISEIPVVSAALGAVAGLPAAQVGMCHFSLMVKGISQVFAAGPPVVKRALGIDIDKEALGGHLIHARKSGLVDNEAEDEADALRQIRAFLSYLPSSVYEIPPVCQASDPANRRATELLDIVPRDRKKPYDPRRLVELVVDEGSAFEMGRYYGPSQITMFARMAGHPIGVLANDPLKYGGAMDAASAQKLEKFVDMCDTFHLPIVNFVDQPGFLIGPASEASGTLRQGARAVAAIVSSTVPWASVIISKVYGVAGAFHQDHSRYNLRAAWPSGEWGSIPVEGGAMAAYRREIEAAADPAAHLRDIEERLTAIRSPFRTAEAFNIEDLIDPRDTRPLLAEWVELAYKQLPRELGRKSRGMRP